MLDQKDGKGNAIQTYGYDALAHVTTGTDAVSNVTTYTYDPYGDVLSKQDPGGNCSANPATGCTTFGYDPGNQLISIAYSDGVTPNVAGVTYDADGQRTAMTDGTGTSSWSWDSLHRMTSYTNGNGAQVQWAYNLRNLATTITYPGTKNVTRGYDAAGRWTSVQDWNSNTTAFGYDANSNLATETFPSASGVVDTSTFNDADQITAITSMKGTTTLFSATYARDSANQLTSDSSAPSANSAYKYTPINQLCYAGSSSSSACSSPPSGSIAYKYDAADNLIQTGSTQQTFNVADELCWTASTSGACASPPTGATTYSYDTRGNRTAVTPSAGQAQTLTYDQANRLTSYAAASTTRYGYNGDGLRMSKTSGGTTTPFVWDPAGNPPLLLKDGTTAYIYGPGGLPVEQVSSSTTYYYHHDQIGSTRLMTDATGTSQATYQFDAFGNLVASTGSIANPFRFAGQYTDSESALYYMRARYYEPASGQFVTLDAAVKVTRQPYAYTAGDPLNGVDPTGLGCFQFSVGGTLMGGATSLGFGSLFATGSVSVGACTNGDVYASATGGAEATSPGLFQVCYPSCNPHLDIEGIYAGGGVADQGSTASEAQDNAGPFECSTWAAGAGPSGAVTTGQGKSRHGPVQTAEVGFFGPGFGLANGNYNTNTGVKSFNVANWFRKLVGW